jgi:predicted nuclease of predicted toxin-antitoxin system
VKLLLDECLPADLRPSFSVHETHTTEWAGLKGKKNGELLDAAEILGYNVLLTIDQGFVHQQNLAGRRIALLILVAPSNQIEDSAPIAPAALAALADIQPGSVVRVKAASFPASEFWCVHARQIIAPADESNDPADGT